MKTSLFAAAAFAAALASGSALADNNPGQLAIEAKVVDSCTVNFTTPKISFQIARDKPQDYTQNGKFKVQCGDQPVKIALNAGKSDNTSARTMKAEDSSTLPYTVYQGNTGQTLWDDNANLFAVDAADSRDGKEQEFRVVIPANSVSASKAGTYTDTLTATVIWGDGATSGS